jgi:tartrate dehydrogenase/decarboxylase/D-malate dehydrogenase
MREFKIAAIPGDGIGKEVVAAGLEVLEALAQRDGG